jgi:hypothetical protein
MQRIRRQQFNAIDAPALARWIVITAFVAITGLMYVYLTVQLNRLGDRKKALENDLARCHLQSEEASGQIAALTSRSALQRRQKEGYLKMIPIAEQYIVRLSPTPERNGEDAIQPVANQRR